VLSADDYKGIRYRMIDGDAVRSPTDVEEGDLGRFNDGSLAALVIHGDMFVAATAGYFSNPLIVAPRAATVARVLHGAFTLPARPPPQRPALPPLPARPTTVLHVGVGVGRIGTGNGFRRSRTILPKPGGH
jgi:hypothetical protein